MLIPTACVALALLAPACRLQETEPEGVAEEAAQALEEAAQEPEPFEPHLEPASGEAEEVMKGFTLAEGFAVSLFAAEPMLANPVCLYVAPSGEVYVGETFRHFAGVTDMRDHMDWLDEDLANRTVEERVEMIRRHEGERFGDYGRASDRVRWLRDSDGDGKADQQTVFADGFDDPAAGIGAGLLEWKGDVYYTCIPDLWRLRDEDGDHVADVRQKLSSGYGVNIALLGHDLHGLRIGPDGKLYFSCGDRGFNVPTESGRIEHPHTGAVLRCNLDGSGLEVFATGLRNPQELVFDEWGNLFTGDNNSDGGDKARWVHVIEGSDAGWRYGYQFVTEPDLRGPWNQEKLWHPAHEGQAAYIVPPIANLADGPSGLAYDPGTGFPSKYRKHFFLCDFRGDPRFSGIHAFTVSPKGASFELGEVERFLWGALPTDCDFGPDGALYFTDWVNGWNKTGKGRVYRLAPNVEESGFVGRRNAAVTEATRKLLSGGLADFDKRKLVSLLFHEDQRVRTLAQFELVERSELRTLRSVAEYSEELLPRVHGIWGLGMLEESDATVKLLNKLLADPYPEVRAEAARVLGRFRIGVDVPGLIECLKDESARVRLHAALTLGKQASPTALKPLVELLRETGSSDPALRHGVVMGLVGCASEEALMALDEHPSPQVRLGVVVALRRLKSKRLGRFLRDPDSHVRVEAARAIYDTPIDEAMVALATMLQIGDVVGTPLVRRVMNAGFRLGSEASAGRLADYALRDDLDEPLRREALQRLVEWREPPGRDPVMGDWRPIAPREAPFLPALAVSMLERGIGQAPESVAREWIRLAREVEVNEALPALEAWARDGRYGAELRAEALEAVHELSPEGSARLAKELLFDPQPGVRAAALEVCVVAAPEEALALLRQALARGVEERRAAYQGLAKLATAEADELLLAEMTRLDGGELPGQVALDLVRAAESRAEASAPLKAALEARAAKREAEDADLARYLDGLTGGDARRGRRLFREKAELSCLRCHRIEDGEGGLVGPDLVGVSERLDRRALLASIVVPNREISEGFRGTVFVLDDDSVLEALVVEEDEQRVLVRNADDELIELPSAEIVSRREGLSSMPEGMTPFLSRREMRDLIEYLSQL